jgi:hypothetical protein
MKKIWILALFILLVLTACSSVKQLPADEAEAFAQQVDALSENLLQAINNQDYAAYTRDMDADMQKASTSENFKELCQLLSSKEGKYLDRKLVRVEEKDQYRAVIYDARFEQEEFVSVRVVYNIAGSTPLIGGLWFDSVKLREE